ncbi:MAG TPA: macro domain-containing protein [Candidatus Brocadiales bacterium]|nr:macro domain-containing protein [Candidatus Brocadiales bacterium]
MKEKIILQQGDITGAAVDAIVNAANLELIMGGGVAGAIHKKGGPSIQEECNKLAPIPLGEAAITGAGALKAKYVIHAASMGLKGPLTTRESLLNSVKNSLKRAEEKKIKSIAFPAIGTGIAGFPKEQCAQVMVDTILEHLKKGSSLEKVYIVLFKGNIHEAFEKYLATVASS